MQFTKMHGLGNDYVYIFGGPERTAELANLSIRVSRRHFSIGSDGLIQITPSAVADFKMRIFNADGSEANMCGNGIRCVGKYVYDKGLTEKTTLNIETKSGIRTLELHPVDGEVQTVSVDMGKITVSPVKTLTVDGAEYSVTPVNVGNPHIVLFVGDAEAVALSEIGPKLEKHAEFPGGVNVEFVQVTGDNRLRMRVWERGSGITMACGTGTCASVAAAVHHGLCSGESPVRVQLDGGELEIQMTPEGTAIMTGPAEIAFEGEIKGC